MGRGGTRYGAGRPGWHPKAERTLRLDVRQMRQRGQLAPGYYTLAWHYSWSNERAGSIGVRVEPGRMKLEFTVNDVEAGHAVELERTPCNFGGTRTWFRCGHCGRRCAVLYLRGRTFRCRLCADVVYTSQSEDVIDRTWRRQQRVEARLGPYGRRPKGMHVATYQRLTRAVWACEMRRDDEIARVLARLGFSGW